MTGSRKNKKLSGTPTFKTTSRRRSSSSGSSDYLPDPHHLRKVPNEVRTPRKSSRRTTQVRFDYPESSSELSDQAPVPKQSKTQDRRKTQRGSRHGSPSSSDYSPSPPRQFSKNVSKVTRVKAENEAKIKKRYFCQELPSTSNCPPPHFSDSSDDEALSEQSIAVDNKPIKKSKRTKADSSEYESESNEDGDNKSSDPDHVEPSSKKKKATPQNNKAKAVPRKRVKKQSPKIKITEEQRQTALKTLLQVYEEKGIPTPAEKAELANKLQVSRKNVNAFFNHRRKKTEDEGKYSNVSQAAREYFNEFFKTEENPSTEQKRELAAKFNLNLQKVSKWFKNKRASKKPKPERSLEAAERLRARKRQWDKENREKKKLEANKPPPFAFTEEQKNFMKSKYEEVNYPTKQQCEIWGNEIGLTAKQVLSFIAKERTLNRVPGAREEANKKRRERKKGGLKKQYELKPIGHPPLTEEEAAPIITKFLEENPNHRETGYGELMSQIYWPKCKIMEFIKPPKKRRGYKVSRLSDENIEKLKEEFKCNQFFSLAKAKEMAQSMNVRSFRTLITWANRERKRVLEKYLDHKEGVDSLPPMMKVLEMKYLENSMGTSEAAREVHEKSGVSLWKTISNTNKKLTVAFFRTRKRLDHEREKIVTDEKDVPMQRGGKKHGESKTLSTRKPIQKKEHSPQDFDFDLPNQDNEVTVKQEIESDYDSFVSDESWDSDDMVLREEDVEFNDESDMSNEFSFSDSDDYSDSDADKRPAVKEEVEDPNNRPTVKEEVQDPDNRPVVKAEVGDPNKRPTVKEEVKEPGNRQVVEEEVEDLDKRPTVKEEVEDADNRPVVKEEVDDGSYAGAPKQEPRDE